ncbi:MAG: YceI family protein [Gemmatimonadaceae bacterium]
MTAAAISNTSGSIGLRPWTIDPAHTAAQFAVRHLMIATVKGTFSGVAGTLEFDPAHPEHLRLDIAVPAASVNTNMTQRDEHLRSADFFDVERHPTITFKGSRVEGDVNGEFKLVGDLTIRGVTREVTLQVVNEGTGVDPWGNARIGFSATTKVNRLDFGLKWNQALETGGFVVGDDVKISLDVEIQRPAAA